MSRYTAPNGRHGREHKRMPRQVLEPDVGRLAAVLLAQVRAAGCTCPKGPEMAMGRPGKRRLDVELRHAAGCPLDPPGDAA